MPEETACPRCEDRNQLALSAQRGEIEHDRAREVTADDLTDEMIRATKAAAHNIRTTLQNAIAASLSASVIDRLRVLSMEIAAVRDERLGGE